MGHYSEQYDAEADRIQAKRDQEQQDAKADEQGRKKSALLDLESSLTAFHAGPKSREISIAITHIETAILWLRK
jgi:hypothetical protein